MSNILKIQADASKIGELIDILNCAESGGISDALESIDITKHEAVIIGAGLEALKFKLGSYGYEMNLGPKKTHLFVTITNNKKGK